MIARVRRVSTEQLARVSAVLVLASLALMSVGILVPRPLAVIVAMSVGQVFGVLGVAIFFVAVLRDLRPVLHARGSVPPPPSSSSGAAPPQRSEPPSAPPARG